jgi:hypothetical protein
MDNTINKCLHTIVAGDTLYNLARTYNTTVEKLLEFNPGIEIYNLQIGSTVRICMEAKPPIGTIPPVDVLREILLHLVRWIRENLGETHFRTIIEAICQEWCSNYQK